MKRILSFVLISLFAVSCSDSTKKVTADLVSGALSSATVTALDCQSPDVVKADVTTAVNNWFKILEEQQKGVVQDLCKAAISEVVPTLIGAAIPATWNCKITKLDNAATVLAEIACANLQ